MKFNNVLPLAIVALLVGCDALSPDEKLNKELPNLSIQELLPKPVANQYCKPGMDSELLYGLGSMQYDEDERLYGIGRVLIESKELQMAKNCMIMAAPEYTRSLCFLAGMVGSRPSPENNREAFNYLAYAASKNESCAESSLSDVYIVGKLDQEQDKTLGMRWLERAARHGDFDSRQDLISLSSEQGNMPVAYAWARIQDDAEKIAALKINMNPGQIAEGDQHYNQLLSQITSQEVLKQAHRKEQIALHSADVYINHPEAFEGMSPVERRALMASVVDTLSLYPDFTKRQQLYAYVLIARRTQSTGPAVDLWQNPAVRAVLNDKKMNIDEVVAKALAILAKNSK